MTVPFDNPNYRVFYACQAVFLEERNTEAGNGGDPTSATFLSGVQAIGASSDNPSTSLLDVGRFQQKYTQYNQQTIEITLERVLSREDNFFYNVASGQYDTYQNSHILHANNFGSKGAKDDNNKVLRNYDLTILYGPDRWSRFGAAIGVDTVPDDLDVPSTWGVQEDEDASDVMSITYPNCLITNISYSIGVDGIRESISLRTKNKVYNKDYTSFSDYTFPTTYPETGEVLRRKDLDLLEDSPQYGKTKLPTEVKQLFNFDTPVELNNLQILGLQSININVDIDYSELTDVGMWRGSEDTKEYEQNRWVTVNLPISVTCSFTGTIRQHMPYDNFLSGNLHKVRNVDNIYTKSLGDGTSTDWQEADREIRIVALGDSDPSQEYFVWDLGAKNYLTSIDYSGGDTGGGNVEATINYANVYSDFVPTKTTSVIDLTNNGPY